MLRTVRITSLCYILGCITFAHESSTRYPGGTLNPRDYTTDLGIVQAIPELLVKTDLLFAELTNLFELTKTG